MDYKTPDGSEFSLQEVTNDDDGNASPLFKYTSITAVVNGETYAGKSDDRLDAIDQGAILDLLRPVPRENISPPFPEGFLQSTYVGPKADYLKSPAFLYEDSEPGKTLVADCLLNEATVFEKLRQNPHRNIVEYKGCVVNDGRITGLCLKRVAFSLQKFLTTRRPVAQRNMLYQDIADAVEHLHSLGLAYNDLFQHNVCVDKEGRAILVDFDSCLPVGQPLLKGVGDVKNAEGKPVSDFFNDEQALDDLHDFLRYFDEWEESDEDVKDSEEDAGSGAAA